MSDADLLGLITMALCLVASMFFSCSETAITSLSEHRARRMLEEGGGRAKALVAWTENPVRVLSTILVGNNVVNTLMGAVATAMTLRLLGDTHYARYSVPIAVFLTTAVLLVFGEITPKAIGRIYAERIAVPCLVILDVLGRAMAPITWLLTRLTNLVIAPALRSDAAIFSRVTADEIDYLVRVGEKEGSIPANQAALLQGIFRFEDKIVRDIMVPRDRVTAIDLSWHVDEMIYQAQASGHSRLPAYEGDLDQIRGILHLKQLAGRRQWEADDLRRVLREPLFVSESLLIQDLLRQFKERRVHLAVVVDDGGHTVGVVTLEDVLEQIVGQIFDETDVTAAQPAPPEAGVHTLEGQASLTRVEELLGVEFSEYDGVSSVGDLLTQLAGQIPVPGSVIVAGNVRFKVLAADARHVARVSVERLEVEEE